MKAGPKNDDILASRLHGRQHVVSETCRGYAGAWCSMSVSACCYNSFKGQNNGNK